MTELEKNIVNRVKDVVQIDSSLLNDISSLIDNKADQTLLNIIHDIHPADIATIINNLGQDEGEYLFRLLDSEESSDVITELDENRREKLLEEFNVEEIVNIVEALDADDATDIVSDLPENVKKQVLDSIDLEDSEDVKELLKYDEESAGGLMDSDFIYVNEDATIQDGINEVRKNSEDFDAIHQLFVLTKDETLLGSVLLKSLIIFDSETPIINVIEEDLIFVNPEIDQEEVANIMKKYDLVVLPVVDSEKRMLGRITIDDIVDVFEEEASEDIQKIAGLSEEQEVSDNIFEISKIRLPWLIISLLMELLNALLMSSHQAVIEQFIIATFFIPIIMAMGGSSGTQSAIVMVRGIAVGDLYLKGKLNQLGKELAVSLTNGLILGLILLVLTFFFWPGQGLTFSFGIVLSLTLLIVIIFATMLGAIIPIILKYFGADPAIATGPFVTTANDIVGMMIYFSIISIYLSI